MASYIKKRGNDNFIVLSNNPQEFSKFVADGKILEVNNIFFVYNWYTDLWTVGNSDFGGIVVRKKTGEMIQSGLEYKKDITILKTKKTMFGKRKLTSKVLPNTFELSQDQAGGVLNNAAAQNMNFAQLYEYMTPYMQLPEYLLPDKETAKSNDPKLIE